MENKDYGLNYVELNLTKLKLYVFVDNLFVNNKNISSQIGYIIVLSNKKPGYNNKLNIRGNIIY